MAKINKGNTLLAVIPAIACIIALAIVGVFPAGAQEPVKELEQAPLNPGFEEFIQNPPAEFYGYMPPPVDISHLDDIPVEQNGAMAPLSLPAVFDWRNNGGTNYVTPVKNQNPCGTCWIFGTLAALESAVLIGEGALFDFSEQNVACCTDPSWVYLTDNRCNAGGWSKLAADTLSKKGTRLEACDPYDTANIDTDTCDDSCITTKYLTGYRQVALTEAAIKDALFYHSPVSIAFYWNSSYFNGATDTYYYTGSASPNHLVCIVGWDDSIVHPGGSGAWIVKNSWGTGWGDNGYFYLCYGSGNMQEAAYYEYKDYDAPEKIYYWDEAGWVASAGYGTDSAWMANVFTMTDSGSLTHVDFWATSNNASYEIKVYQDGNPANGLPAPLRAQTGSCQEAGYYSIPLTSPVSVSAGQAYTISVKMTTPGYYYPIPIERELTNQCEPPIQTGVSYVSVNGTSWQDMGATNAWNASLRLREGDTVSLDVSPSIVEYGIVALGTSQAIIEQISVTNNGDVTEDFSIKCSNATRSNGTTWTLVAGTPVTNEFKHEFSTNGSDWIPLTGIYQSFTTGILPGDSRTFYLRITMPVSTDDPLEHTITITVLAEASV